MDGLRDLARFGVACVVEPRAAVAQARAVGLSRADLWRLITLTSILRVFEAAALDGPMIVLPFGEQIVLAAPMTFFLILLAGAATTVFIIHYTAKALGGSGDFTGALLTIAVVEALVVVLFGVQLAVLFVLPAALDVATALAFILTLLVLVNFIDVVEGFGSRLKALLTLVLGIVGVSFGAALFIVLIGGGAAL